MALDGGVRFLSNIRRMLFCSNVLKAEREAGHSAPRTGLFGSSALGPRFLCLCHPCGISSSKSRRGCEGSITPSPRLSSGTAGAVGRVGLAKAPPSQKPPVRVDAPALVLGDSARLCLGCLRMISVTFYMNATHMGKLLAFHHLGLVDQQPESSFIRTFPTPGILRENGRDPS